MPYYLYLPRDYDESGRGYPVLYLLHGASGDAAEWPVYGVIDAVDRAIEARDIEPFVVVLPQGDFGYWINHAEGGYRWGDYITVDLVAHIDTTYRTLRRPHRRAIGGLSMGATGSLVQAFQHPEVFGIVGAHSPSLRENNAVVPFLGAGEEFHERDPISLASTQPGLSRLQIWIDIGEEDPWVARAADLAETLAQRLTSTATVSTDFNTNGAVRVAFTAKSSGLPGTGISLTFANADLGTLSSAPTITVDGTEISVVLNNHSGFQTTATALVSALTADPLASKLITAGISSGAGATIRRSSPSASKSPSSRATSTSRPLNASTRSMVSCIARLLAVPSAGTAACPLA
jgi:pimeloyl-ACP methyl ester carboxylesterase